MKMNINLEFSPKELEAVVEYNSTTDTIVEMLSGVIPLNIIEKAQMMLNRDIKRDIVFNEGGIVYDCKIIMNKKTGVRVDVSMDVNEQLLIKTMEAYTDVAIYALPLLQLAKVVYNQTKTRISILEEDLEEFKG